MAEWIRNILFPHVDNVCKENGNPEAPCIHLMDGHGTHIHPDIMKEYDIIAPYFIIILPPHNSHYSQSCDCPLFGVAKMKFASIRKTDKTILDDANKIFSTNIYQQGNAIVLILAMLINLLVQS